ncbi:PspC domain-containing protein [Marinilactibacillus psychrotolerans]|uniref:PspC domain-containing protein n=1 Tax=Marinilactibacillus psychrotolerans TaxID=191770 RepID=A0A5R9C3W0_9LACT|nr:PspC domain-containing protein [Marinilactibacillus psychrotolerans]TLQ07492.1 PspC domain-containing protein [Marinilactibacillus psychrotolerans]GEQ33726.1 phage shock protein C [Marinilactibacillus psychrotolerans]
MGNLKKSKDNAVIFGVIGGIGEYFNIDPVLLRVILVVITFLGVGTTIPVYLVMALLMPDGNSSRKNTEYNPFSNSSSGHTNKPKSKSQRKEAEKVKEDDWSDF